MSEDKGGDYSKRLSQELKSSLYQRDLQNQMWNGDVPPQNIHVSCVCLFLKSGLLLVCFFYYYFVTFLLYSLLFFNYYYFFLSFTSFSLHVHYYYYLFCFNSY